MSRTVTSTTVLHSYCYDGGNSDFWEVPPGITSVTFEAFGGSGGWSGFTTSGGAGGWTKGTLAVVPGDDYIIAVGEQGSDAVDAFPGAGGASYGQPGRAKTTVARHGAGGGGASIITPPGTSTPAFVAGGGGGAGGRVENDGLGGAGGAVGAGANGSPAAGGGPGGTVVAPTACDPVRFAGTDGGGGGGGGCKGGDGGSAGAGGGGGASVRHPLSTGIFVIGGTHQGHGEINIDFPRPGSWPYFTTPASTTFTQGANGSFLVSVAGPATPAIAVGGTLPNGVTFNPLTAQLSGTPTQSGTFPLTFTATNPDDASVPATQQAFTLTVQQVDTPPAFTSNTQAAFVAGQPNTFLAAASGFPVPTIDLSSGTLPAGVTLSSNGDGTATISGTPATGTGGVYPALTLRASNINGEQVFQSFTLFVNEAPAITSNNHVEFTAGNGALFDVTTQGFPVPTLSVLGDLPPGTTFTDNGNGTGTFTNVSGFGSGGTYPLQVVAANGIGTDAVQGFVLTMDEFPSISGPANATLYTGVAASIQLTISGFPSPAKSLIDFPAGLDLDESNRIVGVPTGPPPMSPSRVQVSNTLASIEHSITFNVLEGIAPAFSSPAATSFREGQAKTFQLTAAGAPAPLISLDAGALPAGLAYDESTAVLSGTPQPGTAGQYTPVFLADNGHESGGADQSLSLTVEPASSGAGPATTSAPTTGADAPAADPPPSSGPAPAGGPPPPKLDESFVAEPPAGVVLVCRRRTCRPGTGDFVALKQGESLPMGSTIDARKGKVRITVAADAAGNVHSATFFDGLFRVSQVFVRTGRTRVPFVELELVEDIGSCGRAARARSAATKRKPAAKGKTRRLWGDGKGNFRTKGNVASATVRGTKWLVEDGCHGTRVRVKAGIVEVRDLVRGKSVTLRAGKERLVASRRARR